MPATASTSRNGSHIDHHPGEFERRLAAHGHDADEIHHLWDELAADEAGGRQSPGGCSGSGP